MSRIELWTVLGAWSAAFAAFANLMWSAWVRHEDNLHTRSTASLKLVDRLENFALKCGEIMHEIETEHTNPYADSDDPYMPSAVSVQAIFDPQSDWSTLPVQLASECRDFESGFKASIKWLSSKADIQPDGELLYELQQELFAFYGLKANEFSDRIRAELKVEKRVCSDYHLDFYSVLSKRKKAFDEDKKRATLIPALRKEFEKI